MAIEKDRKVNSRNEDEMGLDINPALSLLWSKQSRNAANALSHVNDKAENDKARALWNDKATLNARGTKMCDDFWEDFVLMSKVCLLRDKEADLFDVFDTIRTKLLGAWGYTPEQLSKLDIEIEAEYQRDLLRGLRSTSI